MDSFDKFLAVYLTIAITVAGALAIFTLTALAFLWPPVLLVYVISGIAGIFVFKGIKNMMG